MKSIAITFEANLSEVRKAFEEFKRKCEQVPVKIKADNAVKTVTCNLWERIKGRFVQNKGPQR